METNLNNGWVKLFTATGAQVTLAVPMDGSVLPFESAAAALKSVENLLAAGWLVEAPGLEEGEQKQEVVSVLRREGKDGTPIVAFYLAHPKTVKKFLHSYLNTEDDVRAFEAATGLRLESLPCWPGERDIDKDAREAGKYIVPLPRPINLVWEINPKWQNWSAEGGKATGAIEPHKRILVRYDLGQVPAPKPATGALKTANPPADAKRMYSDGTQVKDDPQVQAIYDAFVKARGQAPQSAEGLRGWYAANKASVSLPASTAA
jgi:hypothetical protein